LENWRRRIAKDSNLRVVKRPAGHVADQQPAKAVVKTAQPLTPAMEDELKAKLASYCGRPVEVVNVVEPSLVAGMIVQLGSRFIDMSLSAQLGELSRRIETALNRSIQSLAVWDLSAEELQRIGRDAR
jgi:hypothetical protein